jgi:hypothetical protein
MSDALNKARQNLTKAIDILNDSSGSAELTEADALLKVATVEALLALHETATTSRVSQPITIDNTLTTAQAEEFFAKIREENTKHEALSFKTPESFAKRIEVVAAIQYVEGNETAVGDFINSIGGYEAVQPTGPKSGVGFLSGEGYYTRIKDGEWVVSRPGRTLRTEDDESFNVEFVKVTKTD